MDPLPLPRQRQVLQGIAQQGREHMRVVAERIEPMPTDGPLTVTADHTFGDVPDPAVVIVPGGTPRP
jgi:hypothetical protein